MKRYQMKFFRKLLNKMKYSNTTRKINRRAKKKKKTEPSDEAEPKLNDTDLLRKYGLPVDYNSYCSTNAFERRIENEKKYTERDDVSYIEIDRYGDCFYAKLGDDLVLVGDDPIECRKLQSILITRVLETGTPYKDGFIDSDIREKQPVRFIGEVDYEPLMDILSNQTKEYIPNMTPETPICVKIDGFGEKEFSLLDIIPEDVSFTNETVNEFVKLINFLESRKDIDHLWIKLSDYMYRTGEVVNEFFIHSDPPHTPTPSTRGWARLQENCYKITPELATKTARTLRRIAQYGYYSETFEEQ